MKKSGFTLIELIFVIVIIGILSAVAVPKFLATKKHSETANFPEVGQQLATKASERIELVGDSDMAAVINDDNSLKDFNKSIDERSSYKTDTNASQFRIGYTGAGGDQACLVVDIVKVQHAVGKDKSGNVIYANALEGRLTEVNTSCNL